MTISRISNRLWCLAVALCLLSKTPVYGETSGTAIEAMQAVLDAGGKLVRRNHERIDSVEPFLDGTELNGVDLHRCLLSEELLGQLKHLPTVECLYLAGTNIKDQDLEHIAALSRLKRLAVWRTQLTDQSCQHFAKMKSLEAVDIQETKLTKASMQTFAQLPELNRLRYSFRLGPESLRHFLSIKKLEPQQTLRLEKVGDTELLLAAKTFASNLEILDLQNSEVSTSGLIPFRDSPIESVYFKQCKIRAEDLAVLPWTNIRYCNLTDSPIKTIELIQLFERDDLSLYVTPSLQNIHVSRKSPDGTDKHNPAKPVIQIFGTLETFPPEDFAQIKNLRSVDISCLESHRYINHILDPASLKYLNIYGENFSLEELKALEHLETLSIDRPLTDDELVHLESLQNLKSLRIVSSKIEGEGLKHLVNLNKLSSLSISSKNLTDAGMPHVAKIDALVSFSAQSSKITDDGLRHLHGMPHLRDCSVLFSGVTKSGLKKLRESLKQPRTIY